MSDPTLETVGRRIAEERKRLEQLASAVGLDRSHLWRIERGERRLDSLVPRRIATTLGVPMDAFFHEKPAEVTIKARRGDAADPALEAMVEWGQRKLDEPRFVEREVEKRGLRARAA